MSEPMSADVRRLKSTVEWYGYLTLDNLDAVADRIRALIGGGQPFTWVACNEGFRDYHPEVRTSQVAEKIRVHRDGKHGSIIVVDTYGVWSIRTDIADQAAGRDRKPHFNSAYLKITRTQVQIEHTAPVGSRLLWVAAVEDRS